MGVFFICKHVAHFILRIYNIDMLNELREIRKQIGLTQEETAKLLGVSRRKYQTYEENNISNEIYNSLLEELKKIGIINPKDLILNAKIIKNRCYPIFAKYPKVRCAYLYGSYSRGEATEKSDVDILVVNEPMGLDYYGMAVELEEALCKKVDLQTHRQIGDDAEFLADILTEGIKIYG